MAGLKVTFLVPTVYGVSDTERLNFAVGDEYEFPQDKAAEAKALVEGGYAEKAAASPKKTEDSSS